MRGQVHLSDLMFFRPGVALGSVFDATLFDLCGELLPTFPLDQQQLLHAAGRQVESDHLGTNGHKWVRRSNAMV